MRNPLAITALILALSACGEQVVGGRPEGDWSGDSPDAAAALARSLREGDRRERTAAARVLARVHPPDPDGAAVRALTDATEDPDPWTRRWAAIALGRRGEAAAAAVPTLVELFRSEDDPVAALAGWALAEIGLPARAALEPFLESPDEYLGRRHRLAPPELPGVRVQRWDHEDECIHIHLDYRGRIEVRRRRYDLPEIASHLQIRADSAREPEPPYASKVWVLILADQALQWVAVEGILTVLVDPDVRIVKVEIGVNRAEDGRLGALLAQIPKKILHRHRPGHRGPPLADATIGLGSSGSAVDSAGLRARLLSLNRRRPGAVVAIRAEGWVSVRDVLRQFARVEEVGLAGRLERFLVQEVEDRLRFARAEREERVYTGEDPDPTLLQKLMERSRPPPSSTPDLT